MIASRPPLMLYAFAAAIVAGVLLATGRYLGGAILVVVALALSAARYISERRGEDETTYLH